MSTSPALELAYRHARVVYPAIEVSSAQYAEFVMARLDEVPPPGDVAADLYLTCACLRGDAGALAAFDGELLTQVPQFLARIDGSATVVDEVKQLLRQRLFVSEGGATPKIAEYGGRGRLASWLRVAAIRIALNLKTSRANRPTEPEEAADALFAERDPELEYLRARYQSQFRDAFAAALTTLEPRDRTVLRMHLIDGLNIDAIGQMYDVHRATAARWIAAARDQLFEATREALHSELGVTATEFASLVRLVRSQLDVSICRILREQDEIA